MAAKQSARRRRRSNGVNLLQLLVLILAFLALFEGKLIYTMLTQRSRDIQTTAADTPKDADKASSSGEGSTSAPSAQTQTLPQGGSTVDLPLAGLSSAVEGGAQSSSTSGSTSTPQTEAVQDAASVSEQLDSPVVVGRTDPPVDDSYFADAVFIGDSRMEGFRNASGITQGTFLTSVGLSTEGMSKATIATADGTISVYQGLSGQQYNKIYVMLGTNDLGYYPWEMFPGEFSGVLEEFHKLQPNAIIYVCSVIYLDEALAAQSASYNTNENVRIINGYLLDVTEAHGEYCCYLNLNEIFSNGYGALKEGASSDGIHLYEAPLQEMLAYLKCHYVPTSSAADTAAGSDEAQAETGADA